MAKPYRSRIDKRRHARRVRLFLRLAGVTDYAGNICVNPHDPCGRMYVRPSALWKMIR